MKNKVILTSIFIIFAMGMLSWTSPISKNLSALQFNRAFERSDAVEMMDANAVNASRLPAHLGLILDSIQSEQIQNEPATAEVFLQRCQSLFADDELNQAILWCQKSGQLDRSSPDSYILLGRIYLLQGDITQEIQSYKQAVQIDPANSWAHYYLGTALEKNKDYSNAIDAYSMALSNELDNFVGPSNFYHRLGLNYHYLYGDAESEKVKGFLDKATELNDYRGSGETRESTQSHKFNIFGQ